MTGSEAFSKILERFPKIEKSPVQIKDYLTLRLSSKEELIPVAELLKEDLGFDYFELVSAVDWLGPVSPEGYIREPNRNPFLPEGATPQVRAAATPGVPYRPAFEMLWLFGNLKDKLKLFLRLELPRETPSVPSLTDLFKAADWHERETFDMFGIGFDGHPNLIKILTPDFIQGHPLRKDYAHVKDKYDD